jgi:hypothetical protein
LSSLPMLWNDNLEITVHLLLLFFLTQTT